MEHSTIHPAKTVGDLRAYAQKFKQNQFCFKFLLDEIAANYQVAYQNGCISVFRSTSGLIPLKSFSDKRRVTNCSLPCWTSIWKTAIILLPATFM